VHRLLRGWPCWRGLQGFRASRWMSKLVGT